ncbi:MAG: hypothetical protein WC508_01910 [Patescibacteria group bacterium]
MLDQTLENQNDLNFIEGTIDHFEEKMAVILAKDGQKILWPIKNLPDDCLAGTAVRLILTTSESSIIEREKLAKKILNEILKNPDESNN